jgi:cytosine/adenosine deaminase-related metal-dependent hydrolase
MTSSTFILADGRFFVGGKFETCSVKVDNGRISEIAASISSKKGERVIPMEGMAGFPGLINSHDHLEFNLFKRIGTPPYRNYIAWGEDIHAHHQEYIQQVLRVPLRLRLLWGAYKNIFSGATTVVHHNEFSHHFRFAFPVEVYNRYSWIHSLALDKNLEKKLHSLNGKPFIIHLAEGIDELAEAELAKLNELGGLRPNTVIVHGVGLTSMDIAMIERSGASLVWCPSSNEFLFHRTAPLKNALGRIRIALGTDSTLTGSNGLLDELRCALRSKDVDIYSILEMVTSVPANIFGMNKGVIAVGADADFLIYGSPDNTPFKALLDLDSSRIKCLLRRGVPLYGDPSLVGAFNISRRSYTSLKVSGETKMVRGNLERVIRRIAEYLPSFDLNGLPIELNQAD